MLLYANGCSNTIGTKYALKGNLNLAYPNVLAKKLDYKVYNDAIEGASIDRIIRTTVDFITGSAIPPDLVLIQIPNPFRFESPDEYRHVPTSHVKRVETNELPLDEEYTFYKKYILNDSLYYELKMVKQMYFLQLLFNEYGIDNYVFILFHSLKHREYIVDNCSVYKNLDKDKFLFKDKFIGIREQLLCNNFKYHPDKHFMADGHNQISDWIFNHLNNIPHNNILMDFNVEDDNNIYRYI